MFGIGRANGHAANLRGDISGKGVLRTGREVSGRGQARAHGADKLDFAAGGFGKSLELVLFVLQLLSFILTPCFFIFL